MNMHVGILSSSSGNTAGYSPIFAVWSEWTTPSHTLPSIWNIETNPTSSVVVDQIRAKSQHIQDNSNTNSKADFYKEAYKNARIRSLTLRYIRKMLAVVKNDIDATAVNDPKALFVKLLETTPSTLKCEIHYHIFWAENTSTTSVGENLANLFSYMLQHTLADDTNNKLGKHISIFSDQWIINSDLPEWAQSQTDAFMKVTGNRQWPDSTFMPIALRGTIIGYVEFPKSEAFELFPEELPNAVSEILKSTELYLSHVSTYFANLQLQEANERQRLLHEEQRLLHQEQTEASYRDQLTNIYNRRGFYEKAIELFLTNPESTGGLIAFDLDRFKKVNDELGHNGGDAVLKHAAQQIQDVIKDIPGALLARFGGEEFIVILPDLSSEETYTVAEIIRKHLSSEPFIYRVNNKDPQALNITTSIGVTQYWPNIGKLTAEIFHDQENMSTADRDEGRKRVGDELWKNIRDADQALYHAKKSGRDITVEYTPKLDHNSLQNYAAQKFSLLKKTVEKFLSTSFLNNTKAPVASENIKKIFSSKGSKHVLPLRGSDRKDSK